MNHSKSRELREQRKKLHTDILAEPTETAEQRSKVDTMLDALDKMDSELKTLERVEALTPETRELGRVGTAPPNDSLNTDDPEAFKKTQDRYHRAYMNFLKYGRRARPDLPIPIRGMSPEDRSILWGQTGAERRYELDGDDQTMIARELRDLGERREQRDMATGGQGAYPGATSGFFVPVGFVDRIEEALKFYGPMLQGGAGMPEIMPTTTGQPLPFPTDNDTTVMGELVGEAQQVTAQDVSISQIVLGAYKYSTRLVKVSIELLQDSAFDIESFLVKKFGIRLGRILNNHMTVGTGSSQPKGIVTAATLGIAAIGASGNDGSSASTNTVGSDDLINLEHSVDPLYRPGALYMMHDGTLRYIKTIKDKYGRPLWMAGLSADTPDTINSYSYRINNDMDQLQTQATSPVVVRKTILFGQVSKYVIRRVKELSVLRLEERFADYGQIAFLGFARYDGNLLDAGTNPVKYLSNSY